MLLPKYRTTDWPAGVATGQLTFPATAWLINQSMLCMQVHNCLLARHIWQKKTANDMKYMYSFTLWSEIGCCVRFRPVHHFRSANCNPFSLQYSAKLFNLCVSLIKMSLGKAIPPILIVEVPVLLVCVRLTQIYIDKIMLFHSLGGKNYLAWLYRSWEVYIHYQNLKENRQFSKAMNMDTLGVVSSLFRYSKTQDR